MDPIAQKFAKAVALHQANDLNGAEVLYREIMATNPEYPELWNMFGVLHFHRGQFPTAVTCLRAALEQMPNDSSVLNNLGAVYASQGNVPAAEECFRKSMEVQPEHLDSAMNLFRVIRESNRADEAIALADSVLARLPNSPMFWFQRGQLKLELGRTADALADLEKATELDSKQAAFWNSLGAALEAAKQTERAETCFRRACELDARFAPAYSNLARWMQHHGRLDEATALFERAIALDPNDPVIASNRLVFLNYLPEQTAESLAIEHRRWGERFASGKPARWSDRMVEVAPERPLRIGYVSPDLSGHAVAIFTLPIFANRDRQQFPVIVYSNGTREDAVTRQLRQAADGWRDIRGWKDEQVAAQIVADQIDILVDLSGHTSHHRLLVFAHRPAPLQFTYLGYPSTTGVPTMDCRISDATVDPAEDRWPGNENLVLIDRPFATYLPWNDAPEPVAPPCLERGYVTFGSLHNPQKLNREVINAWAKVLNRVPQSRLLLYRDSIDNATRANFREQFRARGIEPDRIDLWDREPQGRSYPYVYEHIDVALDTFPWSGHTTACEALYMGVPVVTLNGNRSAGRMTASVLETIGRPDWIAPTIDAYVQLAADVATTVTSGDEVRTALRERVKSSPLCQHAEFTRKLEGAYRAVWRIWCQQTLQRQGQPT